MRVCLGMGSPGTGSRPSSVSLTPLSCPGQRLRGPVSPLTPDTMLTPPWLSADSWPLPCEATTVISSAFQMGKPRHGEDKCFASTQRGWDLNPRSLASAKRPAVPFPVWFRRPGASRPVWAEGLSPLGS